MPKKIIETPNLHRTLGTYSHVTEGVGSRVVFISGQAPLDESGQFVGPGDMSVQLGQVLKNLAAALEGAGATPSDVCKITIFLVEKAADMPEGLATLRKGLAGFFGTEPPASSLAYVSRLVSPDWLVEIEATAVL